MGPIRINPTRFTKKSTARVVAAVILELNEQGERERERE